MWQVRLPADNGLAARKRLAGESQESGEDLEKRRLEGAPETNQEGKAMA
jgi:hypothetical protein